MAIYDKREEARKVSSSPQFKQVGAQFKRQSGPSGRVPESPARFSPNGARRLGSGVDPRLSAPATYGPTPDSITALKNAVQPTRPPAMGNPPTPPPFNNQRNQGGIGGAGGTAGADQSGTGVGNQGYGGGQFGLDPTQGVGKAAVDIGTNIQSGIGRLGRAINPNVQSTLQVPTPVGSTESVNFGDIKTGIAAYDTPGRGAPEDETDVDYRPMTIENKVAQLGGYRVGDTDFIATENDQGGVLYEDRQGNFLSGTRPRSISGGGLGSFSNVGGPGDNRDLDLDTPEGRAEGIRRNVAAYDRQTAALRGLREAQSDFNPEFGNVGEVPPSDTGTYSSYGLPSIEERNANVGREDVRSLGFKKFNAETRRLAQGVDREKVALTRRGQDIQERLGILGEETERAGDLLASDVSSRESARKAAEFSAGYNLDQARLGLDQKKAAIDEAYKSGQLQIDAAKVRNSGLKNVDDAINSIFKTAREGGPLAAFKQAYQTVGINAATQMFPDELPGFIDELNRLKQSQQ